ncbi:uncharacterized protein LOC118198358, partial [Stegodyphus dumicola]|uniref:uncharacterized protein LOC118198358 n=1 Tax=Stegodyphus dumicola TaxID=202533 RepID=UPI0015A90764
MHPGARNRLAVMCVSSSSLSPLFQALSPVDSAPCAPEDAHPPTPSDGLPAVASPAFFHQQLLGLLQKKLRRGSFRRSLKMGNRGSSNAPSPDKKPSPDAGQSDKSSNEASKSAKEVPKIPKLLKPDVSQTRLPSPSPPKVLGSLVESESGESLVSSCSQESNRTPDVRVDLASSPDTSSVSSSLFVDVQEKFSSPDEQGNLGEVESLLDEEALPVFASGTDELSESLQFEPEADNQRIENKVFEQSVIEDFDSDDDDDCSYHDTHEDATDSSEHSPLKDPTSGKRKGGIRSCPGTPDTHHPVETSMFSQYRERKGSLGSVCRSTLPTIGSVPRLDFPYEDDILPEEDEQRHFSGSTQSLSVPRFQVPPPHRHRYRNHSCSTTRRDRSSSELCLHAASPAISK